MLTALNVGLFLIGFVVVVSLISGIVVFIGNRKSATNILFLFFASVNSIWSVLSYLIYLDFDENLTLWIIRFVMFFALLQVFAFCLLVNTFPKESLQISKKKLGVLSLIVLIGLILTLTPYVVSGVTLSYGTIPEPTLAPGFVLSAFIFIALVVSGYYLLIKKTLSASKVEKCYFKLLLLGLTLMFFLIIIFNFLFIAVLGNTSFIPLSVVFTIPFVITTSYAIIRYEHLNMNVIGIEILTFALIVVTFIEVVLSSSLGEIVFRAGVFVTFLIFGILLIRSVMREVSQKEKMGELNHKLKELDKQRDEFVSLAAHELRAPMTALKGYISMVMQGDAGDIPEKARGFLADANTINERLIRLVNNMLNVSRIEEGRMVYQLESGSLSNLVRAVYGQFAAEAERKSLKYSLEISREIKDKVRVDPDRIQEVIANLISNAVKYTDYGSVTVKLSQPSKSTIRLEVIDTGPGISKPEQKKLFRKFYRIETNIGKTTGSGLGLYISKLLIDKFNGKIGLYSELGEGSTFWFELPLVEAKN
jgi:signal transduction histidine kinase